MRRTLTLGVALALAAAPAALADRGGTPHHPGLNGYANHFSTYGHRHAHGPNWKGKAASRRACRIAHRGIAYLVRGRIAQSAVPGATAGTGSMLVDVTRANHPARVALGGPGTRGGGLYSAPGEIVQINSCTRIKVVGKRTRWHGNAGTLADLTAGRRVTVVWRAPRETAYTDLGPAAVITVGAHARHRHHHHRHHHHLHP